MALTTAIENASATPEVAPVPVPKATKSGAILELQSKGRVERGNLTEDQRATEGSKSDKVVFINALSDPMRSQTSTVNGVTVNSNTVVGYKFKALEDMTIPLAPIKKERSEYDETEPETTRQVKAGEVFSLNIRETGLLISRHEYAGSFCGEGGKEVVLSASAKKVNGGGVKYSVVLKLAQSKGSIKEGMEHIADVVGSDGTNKGTATVKPEFQLNFGNFYTKKSISRGTATVKQAGEGHKDLAAAFRKLLTNTGK